MVHPPTYPTMSGFWFHVLFQSLSKKNPPMKDTFLKFSPHPFHPSWRLRSYKTIELSEERAQFDASNLILQSKLTPGVFFEVWYMVRGVEVLSLRFCTFNHPWGGVVLQYVWWMVESAFFYIHPMQNALRATFYNVITKKRWWNTFNPAIDDTFLYAIFWIT